MCYVYHCASRRSVVALHDPTTDCSSLGKTFSQLVEQYGPLEILSIDEARALIDAKEITAPNEIDGGKFFEMLAVVPPNHWQHSTGSETFQLTGKCSEGISLTLCRIGGRYFQWNDISGKSHDDLVATAEAAAALLLPTENRPQP
jgi:hypothetical protein